MSQLDRRALISVVE